MAGIYNADIYCNSCILDIKKRIAADILAGKPSNMKEFLSGDETTVDEIVDALELVAETQYDSDEYPKYASGDEEADSPQHCGSSDECLEFVELPSGFKMGALIGTSLTSDGEQYVKEAVADGGEVAEYWKEEFSWIDFPEEVEPEYGIAVIEQNGTTINSIVTFTEEQFDDAVELFYEKAIQHLFESDETLDRDQLRKELEEKYPVHEQFAQQICYEQESNFLNEFPIIKWEVTEIFKGK